MCPRIEIVGKKGADKGFYPRGIVADVPDEDGIYHTENGQIKVEMNPPEAESGRPAIAVTWDGFEGHERRPLIGIPYRSNPRRVIDVNWKRGFGAQDLSFTDRVRVYVGSARESA